MMRMFEGLSKGYQGSLVPVLSTELSLFDAVRKLDHLQGSVLPTSTRKISHCKVGSAVVQPTIPVLAMHLCTAGPTRHAHGLSSFASCITL